MAEGFQTDLNELNTLANINIPYIEQTCSDAQNALKNNAKNDATVFDETWKSTLYTGVEASFSQTRTDLENLLGTLSTSLEDCAQALREIRRRYQANETDLGTTLGKIGSGL